MILKIVEFLSLVEWVYKIQFLGNFLMYFLIFSSSLGPYALFNLENLAKKNEENPPFQAPFYNYIARSKAASIKKVDLS